ncbi:EEF1A lysine methyltransferase 2 isoform X2 [Protopterus annectens]|uniref:EEF1A lysine methyltransferase 2 isoform X2 n=1 Tax=Protopterus annectens TaxID=7888 RepID=UPI001CFC2C8B|nr:EEF1A lysine methyltransferase 2 isoform X2 [Protopterus annectens]
MEEKLFVGGVSSDDIPPSKLGTKEYWNDTYARELQSFKDIGDVGEIWFGVQSMTRIVQWMKRQNIGEDSAVLDIGTGNGILLVDLAKAGFSNLTGIDYSPAAVELAKCILEEELLQNVRIQVEDFLNPSMCLSGFDVCIDKGTFDAISLCPENSAGKMSRYVETLHKVLKQKGIFIITSCNWTKNELVNQFHEVSFQTLMT